MPAAKKTAEKATETKVKQPATKPAAKKKTAVSLATGESITLLQTGSPIGRRADQRATLIGLGLNKRHRQNVLQDTPAVRGMIEKVKHLVQVVK